MTDDKILLQFGNEVNAGFIFNKVSHFENCVNEPEANAKWRSGGYYIWNPKTIGEMAVDFACQTGEDTFEFLERQNDAKDAEITEKEGTIDEQ